MGTEHTITRRTALIGAAASSVAVALPAGATVVPQGTIADFIKAHELAFAGFMAASCQIDEAESIAAIRAPQVALGKVVDVRGGSSIFYAHDRQQIIAYADWHFALAHLAGAREKWLSAKLAEWDRRADEYLAAEESAALAAARERFKSAALAEKEARLALIVARPRTADEAKTKRAYVATSEPFTEDWSGDDEGFIARIIAELCQTQ